MIVVLHAYSADNAGDGLLVDATLRLLTDAGASPHEVHVVALAPDTFTHVAGRGSTVTAAPGGGSRVGSPLGSRSLRDGPAVAAGRELLTQASHAALRTTAPTPLGNLLASADLIVAVGGGYLRSGSPMEGVKTAAAHLPQLLAAGTSNVPTVYLPQSIGPLRGPVGRALQAALRRIDIVHVRDDRSLREVGRHVPTRRMPDLAVLELGAQLPALAAAQPSAGKGPTVIVARDLRAGAGYEQRLRTLAEQIPDAIWAVQSTGRGNDDLAFYRRMGLGPEHAPLREVLTRHPIGTVISVRLHGALQALLAGWPAIHLSYERKGFGAYGDLGISCLVHHAWRFDPTVVARQASDLHEDSAAFWKALALNASSLQDQREELVDTIRQLLPTRISVGRAAR